MAERRFDCCDHAAFCFAKPDAMRMTAWGGTRPPSVDEIAALAETARARLPDIFRIPAAAVVIRVLDFPPEDVLAELGMQDPFELTGLYDGIPLTERSVMDQPAQPDTIWLYRRPILDEWAARGNVTLGELVTHVLVHEFAHHFGWSDADIARVDEWWH